MKSRSSFSLLAYRDISPGEEITISYIDEGMTRAERQSELAKGYRFTCTCKMCSAPASVIANSDRRRTAVISNVSDVSSTFRRWRSLPQEEKRNFLETSVRMIDGLLKIMKEEDMHRGRIDVMTVQGACRGVRQHLRRGELQSLGRSDLRAPKVDEGNDGDTVYA